MKALASLSRVVFSRYFTSGLISASGTLALGLAGHAIGGMSMALSLASGALMVSFADNPAPVGVKLVELLFASCAGTLCFAAVWGADARPALQLLAVPLLGFLAGLVSLWGKRAVAIAFSLLFITIITLGIPAPRNVAQWASGSALVLLGALLYTAYALLLGRALRGRTKQQALAELVDALSAYMRGLAALHEGGTAHRAADPQAEAAALQGRVNDALQEARDLVLREGQAPRDALWTHMLLLALDLFEAELAAQTDAAPLRDSFDGSDIPDALAAGMRSAAEALDALALGLLHDTDVSLRPPLPQRWDAVQQSADAWLGGAAHPRLAQARDQIEAQLRNLRQADRLIGRLHAAYGTRQAPPPFPELPDARVFVSAWHYDPRQALSHLRLESPVFRHAVRLALALGCALLLARLLFAHLEYDYWIALTIAVILRPNYGVTRQRIRDRVLGTVVGCVLVAAFLGLQPGLGWMLAALFLAVALARTFVTTHYRFTAMAGSVLALLLAHLLHGNTPFLVQQRLLDTVMGAALAWAFSHVLPRWEYQDAPRQLGSLLQALQAYAEVVLADGPLPERTFRIARKRLFDALAAVTGLYRRMLEEPPARRRAPQELAQLITHAYLLAAHLASLRLLRAQSAAADTAAREVHEAVAASRELVLVALRADAGTAPPLSGVGRAAGDPVQARLAQIAGEAARIGQIRERMRRELPLPPAHPDAAG